MLESEKPWKSYGFQFESEFEESLTVCSNYIQEGNSESQARMCSQPGNMELYAEGNMYNLQDT